MFCTKSNFYNLKFSSQFDLIKRPHVHYQRRYASGNDSNWIHEFTASWRYGYTYSCICHAYHSTPGSSRIKTLSSCRAPAVVRFAAVVSRQKKNQKMQISSFQKNREWNFVGMLQWLLKFERVGVGRKCVDV